MRATIPKTPNKRRGQVDIHRRTERTITADYNYFIQSPLHPRYSYQINRFIFEWDNNESVILYDLTQFAKVNKIKRPMDTPGDFTRGEDNYHKARSIKSRKLYRDLLKGNPSHVIAVEDLTLNYLEMIELNISEKLNRSWLTLDWKQNRRSGGRKLTSVQIGENDNVNSSTREKIENRIIKFANHLVDTVKDALERFKLDVPFCLKFKISKTGHKFYITQYGVSFKDPLFDEIERTKFEKYLHYFQMKLLLHMSDIDYDQMVELKDWPAIRTIRDNVKTFIKTLALSLSIITGHDFDKYPQSGLHCSIVDSLKRYIENNPEDFCDLLGQTNLNLDRKREFWGLEDGESCKFPLFTELRRFETTENEDGEITELDAHIMVGEGHDGAERSFNRSKFTGDNDKRMFEADFLSFLDAKNPLDTKNLLLTTIVFIDLNAEKFRKVLGHKFTDMIRTLSTTRFIVEIPLSLATTFIPDINVRENGVLTTRVRFFTDHTYDHKAGNMYNDIICKSVHYRFNIPSDKKDVPFLKKSINSCLEDGISVDNVLDFDKLFLVTQNLLLLTKNPRRKDIKIPFDAMSPSEFLDFLHYLSQVGDDNVHFLISILRLMSKTNHHILSSFCQYEIKNAQSQDISILKIKRTAFRKKYLQLLVKHKILSANKVFKVDDLTDSDKIDGKYDYSNCEYQKNYSQNMHNLDAMKYKQFFTTKFVSDYCKLLNESIIRDTRTSRHRKMITELQKVMLVLYPQLKILGDLSMKKELLTDDEIFSAAYGIDILYIFVAFTLQATRHHSNYLLAFLCGKAIDLFYRRKICENSMSTRELFNKLIKRVIERNTTHFRKNFGIRNLDLEFISYSVFVHREKYFQKLVNVLKMNRFQVPYYNWESIVKGKCDLQSMKFFNSTQTDNLMRFESRRLNPHQQSTAKNLRRVFFLFRNVFDFAPSLLWSLPFVCKSFLFQAFRYCKRNVDDFAQSNRFLESANDLLDKRDVGEDDIEEEPVIDDDSDDEFDDSDDDFDDEFEIDTDSKFPIHNLPLSAFSIVISYYCDLSSRHVHNPGLDFLSSNSNCALYRMYTLKWYIRNLRHLMLVCNGFNEISSSYIVKMVGWDSVTHAPINEITNTAIQTYLSLASSSANILIKPKKEKKLKVTVEPHAYPCNSYQHIEIAPSTEELFADDSRIKKIGAYYKSCRSMGELFLGLEKDIKKIVISECLSDCYVHVYDEAKYKHQLELLNYIVQQYKDLDAKEILGLLIAWMMGTGKSLPYIHFLSAVSNTRVQLSDGTWGRGVPIIYAPAQLIDTWVSKFKKWHSVFKSSANLVDISRCLTTYYKDGKGGVKNRRNGTILLVSLERARSMKKKFERNDLSGEDLEMVTFWKDWVFPRATCVGVDEIHQVTNYSSFDDVFLNYFFSLIKEKCPKCVISLLTGTSNRNDTTFSNIMTLLGLWTPEHETLFRDAQKFVGMRSNKSDEIHVPAFESLYQLTVKLKDKIFFETTKLHVDLYHYLVECKPEWDDDLDYLEKYSLGVEDKNEFFWDCLGNGSKDLYERACGYFRKVNKKAQTTSKKIITSDNTFDITSFDGFDVQHKKYLKKRERYENYVEKLEEWESSQQSKGKRKRKRKRKRKKPKQKTKPKPKRKPKKSITQRFIDMINNSSKLSFVTSFIESLMSYKESNEKLVIGDEYVEILQFVRLVLKLGSDKLRDVPMFLLRGDDDAETRRRIRSTFENTSGFAILFLSTKAGATGIDILCARWCIMISPCWDHTWLQQFIGRFYREGQLRDVYCISLALSREIRVFVKQSRKHFVGRIIVRPPVDNPVTPCDFHEMRKLPVDNLVQKVISENPRFENFKLSSYGEIQYNLFEQYKRIVSDFRRSQSFDIDDDDDENGDVDMIGDTGDGNERTGDSDHSEREEEGESDVMTEQNLEQPQNVEYEDDARFVALNIQFSSSDEEYDDSESNDGYNMFTHDRGSAGGSGQSSATSSATSLEYGNIEPRTDMDIDDFYKLPGYDKKTQDSDDDTFSTEDFVHSDDFLESKENEPLSETSTSSEPLSEESEDNMDLMSDDGNALENNRQSSDEQDEMITSSENEFNEELTNSRVVRPLMDQSEYGEIFVQPQHSSTPGGQDDDQDSEDSNQDMDLGD